MAACDEEEKQSLRDDVFNADSSEQDDAYRVYVNAYLACQGNPEKSIDPEAAKISTPELLVDLAREIINSLRFTKEGINLENTENQIRSFIDGHENDSKDSRNGVHRGADPVMMFNGQFVHDVTDLTINGAGIDFVFTRTYKNQVSFNGPLGFNWTHNFHIWLRVANETVFRCTGDMREEAFTKHPKFGQAGFSFWVPPDGQDAIMLENGNSFVLRLPNGVRYLFEDDPARSFLHRLRRIEDRHGNFLALSYSEDQLRRIEINHPERFVELSYDEQGRISFIRDHTSRQWQYTFDDLGDLVAVTSPATDRYPHGLNVCYEYSSAQFEGELQHNLTRIIDASNQLYLENEYGSASVQLNFNRVVRQRQGGGEYFFEYEDIPSELDFDYADRLRPTHQTTLTERNGQPVRHIYNKFGNLLLREQQIISQGLPRIVAERYRYNRDGQVIASLSPEGTLTQHLYGREQFMRLNGIVDEDEVAVHENLTDQERQGFGRLRASVQRGQYTNIQNLNLPQGEWGDFPDIINGFLPDSHDIIVKYTYESDYGQLLTASDPRFTNSPDPEATNEHPQHQATLIKHFYEGPLGDPNRFLAEIKRPAPTLPNGALDAPVVEQFRNADGTPGYDPQGRLLRHVNPVGTITEYAYFPESPNDPREGYLQRTVVDPNALAITTEYEVDNLGRVVATRLPRSVEVSDVRFVNRSVYNNLDQVVEAITSGPISFHTHSFYDRNGKLERWERDAKDETGADIADAPEVRTYEYDADFNLLRETMGGRDLAAHLVTLHNYDGAGLRIRTFLPQGNQIQFTYDERMLLIARTRGACTDDASTTCTEYDGDGRVRRMFDARGNQTTFTLDPFGRVIAEENALGHITRRDYDKLGNVICIRAFERQPDGSYRLLSRSETEFDELGRAIRAGVNRFDEPPDPVQSETLDDAFLPSPGPGELLVTQTFYDAQGRVRQTVDPLGRVSSFEYDALDRVFIQTDPLGNRTENHYDAHGNLVRRDQIDLVLDNGSIIGQRVFSSSSTYDELDRMVTSTDSLGNLTRYFYDSRGNQVKRIDALGNVVRTDYDIFNRRVATHQELTNTDLGDGIVQAMATTGFEHDRNGNMVAVIDALGRHTQYLFDALDRRRVIIYPDESRMLFDYDRDGNLIRTLDNNGLQRHYTVDVLGRTTRVDVDKSGLLADLAVEGATFEHYEYDGLDRQYHAENDFARCDIHFNSLGWLLSETMTFTTPDAPLTTPLVIEREFNNAGAIVGLTYPNGRKLHFSRDELNRLTSVQNRTNGLNYPGNPNTPNAYDIVTRIEYAGQQRNRCLYGNGTMIGYAHDGMGRLIEIDHTSSKVPLLKIQYLFDAVSNVRIRHDISPRRNVAEIFAYDSFYRLVNEASEARTAFNPALLAPSPVIPPDPIPNRQVELDNLIGSLSLPLGTKTFDYDLVGNRENERLADGSQVGYLVNELDQYETRDGTTFTYDLNGNLKSDGQREYVYDSMNRLVRVATFVTRETIARFFHDARGRRILEVTNVGATNLVWDGDDQVAEYRDGMPFALYVFDDGVDRPLQIAAEENEHWYHADLVGSVRILSNQGGELAITYHYSPFGSMVETDNNNVYNPLRYTARRLDLVMDSYDNRARQYNPQSGRFLQRDPKAMVVVAHLYSYTGNNPLIFTDGTGTERQEKVNKELEEKLNKTLVKSDNPTQSSPEFARLFSTSKLKSLRYPIIVRIPVSESGFYTTQESATQFLGESIKLESFKEIWPVQQRSLLGLATYGARLDSYSILRIGNESWNFGIGFRRTYANGRLVDLETQRTDIVEATLGRVELAVWNDTLYGTDQSEGTGGGSLALSAKGWAAGLGGFRLGDFQLRRVSLAFRVGTGIPDRSSTEIINGEKYYTRIKYPEASKGHLNLTLKLENKGGRVLELGGGIISGDLQHRVQSEWLHEHFNLASEFPNTREFGFYLYAKREF